MTYELYNIITDIIIMVLAATRTYARTSGLEKQRILAIRGLQWGPREIFKKIQWTDARDTR